MSNALCPAGLVLGLSILIAGLAGAPTSVSAQGTNEQTEACSGDAFTLCRDAIPDVAKITACMKVHMAQLSPRCRAVFDKPAAPKAAQRTIAPPQVTKTKVIKTKVTKPKIGDLKTSKPKIGPSKTGVSRPIMRTVVKASPGIKSKAPILARKKAPKVAAAVRKVVGPKTAKAPHPDTKQLSRGRLSSPPPRNRPYAHPRPQI